MEKRKFTGENKKYIWLNKKEYVNQFRLSYKILYYLGCIKALKWEKDEGKPYQIYMGGFYRARFGFRLWNPITWLFLIPLFLIDFAIHTFNGLINTVNDIFSLNNQEVSVNKPLKKNKDYEGED